jgi:predicted transcriptional regulator
MGKRPDGTLEHAVLRVLWDGDRAMTASEINEALDRGLAYTTVATVLGRLHAKGIVDRIEGDRVHRYRPAMSETDMAVRRITDVLATTTDRQRVLAGFVGSLSKRDLRTLRTMLDRGRP